MRNQEPCSNKFHLSIRINYVLIRGSSLYECSTVLYKKLVPVIYHVGGKLFSFFHLRATSVVPVNINLLQRHT